MEWRDLTFKIGESEILSGVTGLLEYGRVLGVMGPSGSGKSTLLNILSGRQRTHGRTRTSMGVRRVILSGQVSIGGRVVKPSYFRGRVAYVFQDNALCETETPRECLMFSAYLRLPRSVSAKERAERVSTLLHQLNLDNCADVMVGGQMRKGLSGGEQKRVAVGVELIANPKLLFLDEPLSGLDSYNAHLLVASLKKLAAHGVGIVMTVHQPSSEIFAELDDLLLVHGGRVAYHGVAFALETHFGELGFPCPPRFNPADHVMFTVLGQPPEAVERIKSSWGASTLGRELLERIARGEVQASDHVSSSEESSSEEDEDEVPESPPQQRNCFEAIGVLMGREARKIYRSGQVVAAQYMTCILVSGAYAWLFYDGGRKEGDTKQNPNCEAGSFDPGRCGEYFRVHITILTIVAINVMQAAMSHAMLLQADRPVYLRERAGGCYTTLPYFLCRSCFEIPMALIYCVLNFLILYWLVGLRANIVVLILETSLLSLASNSLMYVFAAMATNMEQVVAFMLLPQIAQTIFSGLLVPLSLIPTSLQWLKWTMPLYYGLVTLLTSEFGYVFDEAERCAGTGQECPGVQVKMGMLASMDVRPGRFWWPNLTMTVVLAVAYRALAIIVLWRKSRTVL